MASRNLADCAPALEAAWHRIVARHDSAYPDRTLVVTCTYRTPEEQMRLYAHGRVQLPSGIWIVDSDPKTQILTNCDGVRVVSKHNVTPARAIDFAVVLGGKAVWMEQYYATVGAFAEAEGLVWGGAWPALKDMPHIELPAGRDPA
jgi:hypothetical protein